MGLHNVKNSTPGNMKIDDVLPTMGTPVSSVTLAPAEAIPVGAIAEDLIKHFSMPKPEPAKPKAVKLARPKIQHTVQVRPDADGPDVVASVELPTPKPGYVDILGEYKRKRMRVSFVMDSGTFSMTVMDVKLSAYTVAIVTNSDSESSGFIPALGSTFKLEYPGVSLDCFYPGSYVSIPELSLDIMFLGRQQG